MDISHSNKSFREWKGTDFGSLLHIMIPNATLRAALCLLSVPGGFKAACIVSQNKFLRNLMPDFQEMKQ